MEQKTYARMQELQEELISWRLRLHQHPEMSFELPESTAFVMV